MYLNDAIRHHNLRKWERLARRKRSLKLIGKNRKEIDFDDKKCYRNCVTQANNLFSPIVVLTRIVDPHQMSYA